MPSASKNQQWSIKIGKFPLSVLQKSQLQRSAHDSGSWEGNCFAGALKIPSSPRFPTSKLQGLTPSRLPGLHPLSHFPIAMEEQSRDISQQFLNLDPQWERYPEPGEIDGGNYKQLLDWWLTLSGLHCLANCNGVELPLLPVDVAIGNRAVKPIKRQEEERKTQPLWKP